MKTITLKDFRSMNLTTELETGILMHRLGRFYCKPSRRIGQCTENCRNCKNAISSILARCVLRNSGEAVRDPFAMVVWACREVLADIQEAGEKPSGQQKDWLGQVRDDNPFQMVLEEL